MPQDNRQNRVCTFYIRHAGIIGALYCILPTLVYFLGLFVVVPFRRVYLLRLLLSLVAGGALAATVNRYGLSLWLAKHSSPAGPGTALDGLLIGAAIGWGCTLIPPLTALIATQHLEQAKTFIIVCWLLGAAVGGAFGVAIGSIGNRHLDRGLVPTGSAAR